MLIPKNFLIATVAVSALLVAIGGMTPSNAQIGKPAEDVNVVNTPTVNAQQAGAWTVGAQLAPGSTVGISGTPTVSISGTPTVNVASLPALSMEARPAFPLVPYVENRNLTAAVSDVVFGRSDGTIGVTAITFSNFEVAPVQVNVSNVSTDSSGSCAGTVVGGTLPQFPVLVPERSTLHLTYPTALVFQRTNDASCIRVFASGLVAGSLRVAINGFVEF